MPIEPDDVIHNKCAIIERSLRRMKEEFDSDPSLTNCTHVDAMILNIERAFQAAIDLAMHLVSLNHSGIPQNSADAFILLEKSGLISKTVAQKMVAMTGFRNVAIHEYQELEIGVLRNIAENEWKSLLELCRETGIIIKV